MSDFRFRTLEHYQTGGTKEHMTLAIPAPRSPRGKVYQYSPNPEATPRLFQIGGAPQERTIPAEHAKRIRRQPGPGHTICPYSGHQAPDEDFIHFDDIQAIKDFIAWAAKQDVGNWLADLSRDFNRRQPRGGMLTVHMDVQRPHTPPPLTIREDLLRAIRCDICQREYGVYAIALFCPDCGAPNLALHFQRETALVQQQISLAEAQHDAPELAYRLLGNAHEDVLTAFEATLKAGYIYLIRQRYAADAHQLTSKKAIGNAFQNIARAAERFATVDLDPFTTLTTEETAALTVNIQKRHVIGHNLGIADEHYNELTQEEQPGETVQLIGTEITQFAQACTKVIIELDNALMPGTKQATGTMESSGVTEKTEDDESAPKPHD